MQKQASVGATEVSERIPHELFEDYHFEKRAGQVVICAFGHEKTGCTTILPDGVEVEFKAIPSGLVNILGGQNAVCGKKVGGEEEPSFALYNHKTCDYSGGLVTYEDIQKSPDCEELDIFVWLSPDN